MSDAAESASFTPPDHELEDQEYSEEEIEVEVTDEENSADEEVAKLPQKPPSTEIKKGKESVGRGNANKKVGRVTPSKEVKALKMGVPGSSSKNASFSFSPDKNPFPVNGIWNAETIKQIEISFPILTGKNETTNELTRSSKPESRFWKGPISFKYGNFTSETLRFDNVHIPFYTGKGYGDGFIYMSLPTDVGEAFGTAGKRNAPTKIVENSLMPDRERWWKIANKVEGVFGIINNATRLFQAKSLSTIFDATQSGISCSVTLRFYCKASTEEKEPLKATTARTISAEVVRGYITSTDINVQLPTRISRQKTRVEPVATGRDVATDSLMMRLGELGL